MTFLGFSLSSGTTVTISVLLHCGLKNNLLLVFKVLLEFLHFILSASEVLYLRQSLFWDKKIFYLLKIRNFQIREKSFSLFPLYLGDFVMFNIFSTK